MRGRRSVPEDHFTHALWSALWAETSRMEEPLEAPFPTPNVLSPRERPTGRELLARSFPSLANIAAALSALETLCTYYLLRSKLFFNIYSRQRTPFIDLQRHLFPDKNIYWRFTRIDTSATTNRALRRRMLLKATNAFFLYGLRISYLNTSKSFAVSHWKKKTKSPLFLVKDIVNKNVNNLYFL